MIIVNKEHNEAYNLTHIVNIYIGSDGTSIKVSAGGTTRGGILGKYNSFKETQLALEIMLERIKKADCEVLYMPSDEEVSGRIKSTPADVYHHITGKKTKGHGGS